MFCFKAVSERSTLVFSAIVSGVFALLGIVWGIVSGSLAILFDGAYSFVSLVLSLLSVTALRWAESPADKTYNFGRILAEPLAIAIKGSVITLVCVVSLVSAIKTIHNGGREVEASLAIVFSLFSLLCCLITWQFLKRSNAQHSSALILAEEKQWLMDSLLSATVLIGFLLSWGLSYTEYSSFAVYVDPVLVLLASLYFIAVPLRMMVQGFNEILLMTPSPSLRHSVHQAMHGLGIKPFQCKMAKVGSYLLLEVRIEIDKVEQMQGMQESVEKVLSHLPLEIKAQLFFQPKVEKLGPNSWHKAIH
ncbi:cation transporter [Nitrincola tibetensis]|uniref:Cation transporter n=1 Tax=Nitrincola tibetensis TaxID=2219697 RepID=A0A364NKK5_9GAMM|nr:cation diffusion facilitator family transporter [Nitrincola tibetensis]RAU17571.1 cation transporter [Nitrincola tibetensis]